MERNERPIRRWISMVRPGLDLRTSRGVRVAVARGSIEYSACYPAFAGVPGRCGTVSSMEAAQSTCVLPTSIKTSAFGGEQVVLRNLERAQLIWFASVSSHEGRLSWI